MRKLFAAQGSHEFNRTPTILHIRDRNAIVSIGHVISIRCFYILSQNNNLFRLHYARNKVFRNLIVGNNVLDDRHEQIEILLSTLFVVNSMMLYSNPYICIIF